MPRIVLQNHLPSTHRPPGSFSSRRGGGSSSGGFLRGFAVRLSLHQIRVRREIIKALAFEISDSLELVFLHEREQLLTHRLNVFITEFHYAGADLHGVTAEQDEFRRVISGFDAANGR
jgi:hypothetical protein